MNEISSTPGHAPAQFDRIIQIVDSALYPKTREPLTKFLEQIKPMLLIAPGSTKVAYHHARKGGLLDHILEVYYTARDVRNALFSISTYPDLTDWDLLLCAVLHDIHKACDWSGRSYYVPNILTKGNQSEAIPFKKSDVCFSFIGMNADAEMRAAQSILNRNPELIPGGELSLALVSAMSPDLFETLNEGVKFAIRHHDGMYGLAYRELLGGIETPLQQVLHFADMVSSRRERWSKPKTQE